MIIKTPPKITNKKSLLKYVEVDLWSWLKDLSLGLLRINFTENFQQFLVEDLTIEAGTQVSIANEFFIAYPGKIPTGRIIVRQQGNAIIDDGDKVWTETHVYLKNVSANAATISVIFFL